MKKCPICGRDGKNCEIIITKLGMCETCYAKRQPLVKVKDGKGGYVPWSYNYFVHPDDARVCAKQGWVEDSPDNAGMDKDYTLPKITFCEEHNKWKISYTGTDCYVNDNGAIEAIRYFDTADELLNALGLNIADITL